MTTLEGLARSFAAVHPRRVDDVTGKVTTWNLWCASLIYRFTGASLAYDPATAAWEAARDAGLIVSTDPSKAPIGAIHYWGTRGNAGHVAIDVRGGGRYLFMASAKVTELVGVALGFCSFDDYKTSLVYRGWSMSYGINEPMTGASDLGTAVAGGGTTPFDEGNDMPSLIRIIFDQGDNSDKEFASTAIYNETTGWLQTSTGRGPRGTLEFYTAIAGVLGFRVSEVHVNRDGWLMSRAFVPPKQESAASVNVSALAEQLEQQIGPKLAGFTADELAERLRS